MSDTVESGLIEEIRRLRRRVAELETQQAHPSDLFRPIVDSIAEAVIVANENGEFIFFNPAVEEITGVNPADVSPPEQWYKQFDVYYPDQKTPFPPEDLPLTRALQGEDVHETEFYLCKKDGKGGVWLSATARPLLDEQENSCGGVVVLRNVTERIQMEEAHRKSEALLADFFENAPIGMHWIGPEGIIEMANRAELEMLGYSREEYVGRHFTEFYVDPEVGKDILARLKSNETLCDFEAQMRCKDGSVKHILIDSNVLWEDAQFIHARCFTRDISRQRKTEQRLGEQSRMLELFFEHTLSQVAFLDRDFNFIRVNDAYAKACQRDVSEFPGHNHFEFYPSDAQDIFEEVVATKKPFVTVARPFVFPDHPEWGVTYWDWTLVPVLDEAGEVELLVFSLNDVTKRTKSQQKASKLKEELAYMGRLSTMGEMAAGLAHELNQPLAAISSYCYVGQQSLEQEQESSPRLQLAAELFEKTKDQAIRSGKIIHRLRNFVRKTAPIREVTNVHELLKDVVDLLKSEMRLGEVQLQLNLDSANPSISIDAIQIQQVLVNLIRNAIESLTESDDGRRVLTVSTSENGSGAMEIAVRDTGKGLAVDNPDKVFEAFFTTKSEGMGMGLAISRSIIDSHDGRLWVTENAHPQRGVAFHFTLPMLKDGNHHDGSETDRLHCGR